MGSGADSPAPPAPREEAHVPHPGGGSSSISCRKTLGKGVPKCISSAGPSAATGLASPRGEVMGAAGYLANAPWLWGLSQAACVSPGSPPPPRSPAGLSWPSCGGEGSLGRGGSSVPPTASLRHRPVSGACQGQRSVLALQGLGSCCPRPSPQAAVSHPEEVVPDVLLRVLGHLVQPDHAAAHQGVLQLPLGEHHLPRELTGLWPRQQEVASVAALLQKHGWKCKGGGSQQCPASQAAEGEGGRAHPGRPRRAPGRCLPPGGRWGGTGGTCAGAAAAGTHPVPGAKRRGSRHSQTHQSPPPWASAPTPQPRPAGHKASHGPARPSDCAPPARCEGHDTHQPRRAPSTHCCVDGRLVGAPEEEDGPVVNCGQRGCLGAPGCPGELRFPGNGCRAALENQDLWRGGSA